MPKKIIKLLSITAFILAFIFLIYGIYQSQENQTANKQHTVKQVVYVDKDNEIIPKKNKKVAINLCSSGRWKTLEIIEEKQVKSVENKALYTQFNTQTELQGRHKNQQSILLTQFFTNNSQLQIKSCDATLHTFSKKQIIDNNIRLVLNSKGALKLIQSDDEKIKVIARYLFSITKISSYINEQEI